MLDRLPQLILRKRKLRIYNQIIKKPKKITMKYLNFILTSCNKMPIYTFSFLTISSEKKIKRIDPRIVTNPETLPRVTQA